MSLFLLREIHQRHLENLLISEENEETKPFVSTKELRCEKGSWFLFVFPKATSNGIACYWCNGGHSSNRYKHTARSPPTDLRLLVPQVGQVAQTSHATHLLNLPQNQPSFAQASEASTQVSPLTCSPCNWTVSCFLE